MKQVKSIHERIMREAFDIDAKLVEVDLDHVYLENNMSEYKAVRDTDEMGEDYDAWFCRFKGAEDWRFIGYETVSDYL